VANKSDYLARLQVAVSQLHNCGAAWRESVPVHEIFRGKTLWRVDRATDAVGESHDAYHVHPPYLQGTGYTFWTRDVTVPAGARLTFFTGMGEKAPGRSDGVVFRVDAAELAAGKPAAYRRLFEHQQVASRWIPHRVSLADWAAKRVRLYH